MCIQKLFPLNFSYLTIQKKKKKKKFNYSWFPPAFQERYTAPLNGVLHSTLQKQISFHLTEDGARKKFVFPPSKVIFDR